MKAPVISWYLVSNISSTENDVNRRIDKAWSSIDRLSIIWKADLSDEKNLIYSTLWLCLYYCWIAFPGLLQKNAICCLEQILEALLPQNNDCAPTCLLAQKTIQILRKKTLLSWRSKDELISNVLQCTPSFGQTKVGRTRRTYIIFMHAMVAV